MFRSSVGDTQLFDIRKYDCPFIIYLDYMQKALGKHDKQL